MSITSDPSVARFKAHTLKYRFKELALKDFLIISGVISFHASRIHFTTVKLKILKTNQPSKAKPLKCHEHSLLMYVSYKGIPCL